MSVWVIEVHMTLLFLQAWLTKMASMRTLWQAVDGRNVSLSLLFLVGFLSPRHASSSTTQEKRARSVIILIFVSFSIDFQGTAVDFSVHVRLHAALDEHVCACNEQLRLCKFSRNSLSAVPVYIKRRACRVGLPFTCEHVETCHVKNAK